MASSSSAPEPLIRMYQDPIEELRVLLCKYEESRKKQRLVTKSEDTHTLQANNANQTASTHTLQANNASQTTSTSKAHGKCFLISFFCVV